MKSTKHPIFIDFEFNRTLNEKVNLVCCVTKTGNDEPIKWWLHNNPENQDLLRRYLSKKFKFISYGVVAEARSFISLGLDPLQYRWIDLFLEYRCLTNHNDELQWGQQLVDGKIKSVKKPKPKWERVEGEEIGGFRATHSLAEATFKLTKKVRDTEEKTRMRDLIISDPDEFTEDEKWQIMDYCASDVIFLDEIYKKIRGYYKKYYNVCPDIILNTEMENRGRYAAHTALMESKGYPIDIAKTRNFSNQVGNILFDCQREINKLFPDIAPFRWDKKTSRFTWNQIATRGWVATHHDKDKWMKTDSGDLSLSLEAFERFYPYKHHYPKDNFGAQMVRYLKLKQNLYGFVPSPDKKKKTFWDSVGEDGRVRPYMNIYGSQSSRSQPAATGFMFLKPAWMRALVIPKEGYAMAGIDYGSQEFFIQALLSQDKAMIDAYMSGDVYLAFAKASGMVPQNATKESHKVERNLAKATVLGIGFLMSKYGLAIKLSQDSGKSFTEDDAQNFIDKFYETYPDLAEFQENVKKEYAENKFLKLPCGWTMFGDNDNFRSVANFPVQGMGASVMRRAVDIVQSKGIYVPFTLHDALYIEYKIGEEYKIWELAEAMREAFSYYFKNPRLKEYAKKIKLDPYAWSPNYEPNGKLFVGPKNNWEVPCGNLYLDDRASVEYNEFSKYFYIRTDETDNDYL